MSIENTDENVPWLTNYLETILMQVWYPITVCTQSHMMKTIISNYLEVSGNPAFIDFKLHDFGYRGSTSYESAGIGGCAHLVNFKGTDTFAAVEIADMIYDETMAGFSIPVAEHSTITSWGRENELEAFRNMLVKYPNSLVAVVSDSYNIFNACEEFWGTVLKDEVMQREGCLVIRPDSGDPVVTVYTVLDILGSKFGFTINEKKFKVLDPHVRVIQGDGIDIQTMDDILHVMEINGWSADNITFGSGGGLLQKVNRDTMKFAIKCSAVKVDGQWRDVYKDPLTDSSKKSYAGKLALVQQDHLLKTIKIDDYDNDHPDDLLEVVYENGELVRNQTLSEIRQLAWGGQ